MKSEQELRFEKTVKELVSTDAPDLWKTFKDGVLKACDEVCGKKKSRRHRGDMWWWNEEVMDIIARKKAAFKECADSIEMFNKSNENNCCKSYENGS